MTATAAGGAGAHRRARRGARYRVGDRVRVPGPAGGTGHGRYDGRRARAHRHDQGLVPREHGDSKEVTGNITTNLFLYFAVKTSGWCHSLICLSPHSWPRDATAYDGNGMAVAADSGRGL